MVKWMDLDTLLQNKCSEELSYVQFLLEKSAEVTNERNRIIRTWLDRISTKMREEYKLRRGGPPNIQTEMLQNKG